ncbi:MAG: hypothetical protein J7M16_10375 [Anaerolineae bacterium]|nr:hypothetical protein [Anaerolineae bacterium]
MSVNPTERSKEIAAQDVFSTLSLFQPTIVQARPAVELVQLPDDNLPSAEEIEDEQDCAACN